jgi:hypothetical protein
MVIETKGKVLLAAPTISAGAYASGDQLGSLVEITSAVDAPGDTATVLSVSLHDAAAQSSILQLLFFKDKPVVTSADNAALNISDAEMADKCLGYVGFVAADYVALSASSIGTVRNVNLLLTSRRSQDNPSGTSIWVIARCGGTPTYGATTGLTFSIGVKQD